MISPHFGRAVAAGLLVAAVAPAQVDAQPDTANEMALAAVAESFLREQIEARGESMPPAAEIGARVERALAARRRFAWGASVPQELFLRYVLPETNLTEPETVWRDDLAERLAPLVAGAASAGEAAVLLNNDMWQLLGVGYDAKPPRRPALSPEQTMARGRASCTGLAILLVDACRALGIPARIAGIPAWVVAEDDPRARGGYHQWVEVWDGSWRSLSAIDASELDHGWFMARAARTDERRPEHRIFAASYVPTGRHFPLPWAPAVKSVPGIDVTALYTHRRAMRFELPAGARLALRRHGELFAVATDASQTVDLGVGESYDWVVTGAGGEELGGSSFLLEAGTPSPLRLLGAPAQAGEVPAE